MSKIAILFFGANYRWIFSPIILFLGMMILFKRASWSISRLVGIVLFFIATTSILGWYAHATIGYFDIYNLMEQLLG
jgi:hypothetical protein